MLTKSMLRILAILKSLVLRYVDEEAWAWAGDGECVAWDVFPLLNLTDDEVSNFATTSCRPTLWAFRALANRLGVTVPQADWFWHNEPRAQFQRFVAIAMEARALVGAPAGHAFGRALGFLARGLEVEYEFTRKGDTVARAYWSDRNLETGEEFGGCISVYQPHTCPRCQASVPEEGLFCSQECAYPEEEEPVFIPEDIVKKCHNCGQWLCFHTIPEGAFKTTATCTYCGVEGEYHIEAVA